MRFMTLESFPIDVLWRRRLLRAMLPWVTFLSLSSPMRAQNTADISGLVQDPTGRAIAKAQVKLTQINTGFVRTVLSDDTGLYIASNLPIGPYRLEVNYSGFSPYTQTGITLQVNSSQKINIALKLGTVTEEVRVEADAGLVETQNAGVGQVVDNRSVLELPLGGRQVSDLLLLSPGASANAIGGFSNNRGFPVIPITIAGGGPGSSVFTMDGATHNDPATNMNIPVPFPDALEEFKVETSAVPAQYGQHAAAVVSLVTKSGTNQYHGSAFEFVRNRAFNARNTYALYKDPLKRNQFGGAVGGPVFKNRLFFFGGYQGTITRTDATTNTAFVPTQAMLNGDFTGIASPQCNNNTAITLKAPTGIPLAGNTVDPSYFDKASLAYLKYIPVSSNVCGRVQYGFPTPSSEHQALGRLDYQKSDRHSMFGRFFWARYQLPFFFDGKNALTTPSVGLDNQIKTLVFGDTYSFGPNVIHVFHATWVNSDNARLPSTFVNPKDEGVNVTTTPLAGAFTNLGVTNGFNLGGGGNNNAQYNYKVFQFSDSLQWVKGAHQISIGVDAIIGRSDVFNTQYSDGQFTFDGSVTGNGLIDFLLGRVGTFQQGGNVYRREHSLYLGLYAQDVWKLNPHLTINAGLRWEPFFPLSNADNQVLQFKRQLFDSVIRSKVYVNAPAGLQFPGDPGYPGSSMTSGHLNNFGPRVGVSWDPRGQGRETIRAAYGIFYDSPPLFDYIRVASVPPWGALVTLNNISFSDPYANYPGGNPFPVSLTSTVKFPTSGTYWIEPAQSKPTYVQQWNFSLQKQFGKSLVVTLTYFGNKSTHLWGGIEINPSQLTAGATTGNSNTRRLLVLANPAEGKYYSSITQDDQGGNGNYNAGLAAVQKRLSNNFSFLANYTWSHCINDTDAQQFLDPVYPNPYDRNYNRGNCSTDRRQVLNIAGVLSTPRFSSRVTRIVASNWQVSPILQASSGAPLNLTAGRDVALIGSSTNQRVNLIGNAFVPNPTASQWFNTAAFKLPDPGTFGNLGRNVLFGPSSWTVNLALSRKFILGKETSVLELRAEAFNLANRVNPGLSSTVSGFTSAGGPTTVITNSLFGKITTAADPRIMQFALKYTF